MPRPAWHLLLTPVGVLFPRAGRSDGALALTAALLSRLILPPFHRVVRWPHRTGQIRAAGKWFYAFFAASCLIWAVLGYWGCQVLADWAVSWQPVPTAPAAQPAGAVAAEWAGTLDNLNRTLLPNAELWLAGSAATVAFAGFAVTRTRPGLDRRLRFWAAGPYLLVHVGFSLLLYAASFVAAFCVLAVTYPGLTTGGDLTARLPWQVWYGVLVGLLIYRQSSPINPRVEEFTATPRLPPDSPYTWLLRLVRLVREDSARERMKAQGRDLTRAGYQRDLARESERLADLRAWRAFYEREGLCDLVCADSPERRYYTSDQRLAFDRAYSELLTAVAESEEWVERYTRWIAEAPDQSLAEPAGDPAPPAATG